MTPTTKSTRRKDWASLNFAGTIDWAVDLQAFTSDDYLLPPPKEVVNGLSCVWGEDPSGESGTLCDFTCTYGYCPQPYCTCLRYGTPPPLPGGRTSAPAVALDNTNFALSQLCNFACQWSSACDFNFCEIPREDILDIRASNFNTGCIMYENGAARDAAVNDCLDECQPEIEAAKADGRGYNYGCMITWPGPGEIPWTGDKFRERGRMMRGKCLCDSPIINALADVFIEALIVTAQVRHSCSPRYTTENPCRS